MLDSRGVTPGRRQASSTCSSVPPSFCTGTEKATIEGLREASSIYSLPPPRSGSRRGDQLEGVGAVPQVC